MAELILDAEVKLGELLASIDKKYVSSGRGTIEKKKTLPPNIDKRQSHEAQELANIRSLNLRVHTAGCSTNRSANKQFKRR